MKLKVIKRAAALVLCTAVLSGSPMSIPTLEGSVGYTSTVFAAPKYTNRNVAVIFGYDPVKFKDQGPVIIDGRTFVPIRAVWEEIEKLYTIPVSVEWDSNKKETTLWMGTPSEEWLSNYGYLLEDTYVDWYGRQEEITVERDLAKSFNTTIKLTNGSKIMRVSRDNGKTWEEVTMDVAPTIINGRTLLPVRYPFEAVGFKVSWDPDYKYDGYNGCIGFDILTYNDKASEAHKEDVHEVRAYLEKTCSNKPVRDYKGDTRAIERDFYIALNKIREYKGIQPLQYDPLAQPAADLRAKEIQTHFDHQRPNGEPPGGAVRDAGCASGYIVSFSNECIGEIKDTEPVWEVAAGFYNSKGHRRILCDTKYTHICAGVSKYSDYDSELARLNGKYPLIFGTIAVSVG